MNFENGKEIKLSSETIERTPPPAGGTVIIMQRHGNYDRSTGHLTLDGHQDSLKRSEALIEGMIEQIPEEERQFVTVLVVASPTIKHEGRRSMETAANAIVSVQEAFDKYGIPQENLLTESPRPVEDIEEPRMFQQNTEYWKTLVDRYGSGTQEFWKAYEEDHHQEEREQMGEEGPVEMSDRFAHFTNVLGRYARLHHANHKGEPARLIIWNVSHYDTVTTFFKNHVASIDQKEYIPVDYDGGISLMIDKDGEASVKVGEATYPIELTERGTKLKRHENEEEKVNSDV